MAIRMIGLDLDGTLFNSQKQLTAHTRQVLERESRVLQAGEDTVRVKTAAGAGARKAKLEYEDLAAIARRRGETLAQVRRRLAPLLEE